MVCGGVGSANILVQNIVYGGAAEGRLDWAYATQPRGLFGAHGAEVVQPVNTFLSMSNWLKMQPFDSSTSDFGLTLREAGGGLLLSETRSFSPADTGLHVDYGNNAVGGVRVSSESQMVADGIRVLPSADGGFGYIFSVPSLIIPHKTRTDVEIKLQHSSFIDPISLKHFGDSEYFIAEQSGAFILY